MKVSEIPYRRYPIEEAKAALEACTQKVKKANSEQEVLEARSEYLTVLKHFVTASALAEKGFTLNTRDAFYAAEKDYYNEVSPQFSAAALPFAKAVLESPYRKAVSEVVLKNYACDVKAMDERIVPDMQEENRTVTEYSKLMSEMSFEFRGQKMPLPTLRGYMADKDPDTRREAYSVLGRTLEAHAEQLDGIFDRLVHIRTAMARKLGCKNFVELGYNRMHRICYDQAMVEQFRQNVRTDLVPVVCGLKEKVRQRLGLKTLSLADNDVYFKEGNPRPLGSVEEIFAKGKKMYEEMSPETGDFIHMMLENEAFDVLARDGKWGGGYCTSFPDFQQPFILANFNGSADDIDVLTHEAGHAFADYCLYKNGVDIELNVGGMETAETHSMSMECFCWKWMDDFFGARGDDYRLMHLSSNLTFIPYGTIVDYFQHLVYEHPEMTPSERNKTWKKLEGEFRPYMSADGLPYLEKGTRWQYQMHIFENPFYYIDYCLAQTTALQFLVLSQKDYADAFGRYLRFLKRGGSMAFTDLLKEAGLQSPFRPGALAEVGADCQKILEKLQK